MKVYIVWYANIILRVFKEYENATEYTINEILDSPQGKMLHGNGYIWYDIDDYLIAIQDTFDNGEEFNEYFIEERDIEDM